MSATSTQTAMDPRYICTSNFNSFLFLDTLAPSILVSLPSTFSFFLNTKLTTDTEMFVNDSVKVVNITKVVDITREEEDMICKSTSVSVYVFWNLSWKCIHIVEAQLMRILRILSVQISYKKITAKNCCKKGKHVQKLSHREKSCICVQIGIVQTN